MKFETILDIKLRILNRESSLNTSKITQQEESKKKGILSPIENYILQLHLRGMKKEKEVVFFFCMSIGWKEQKREYWWDLDPPKCFHRKEK